MLKSAETAGSSGLIREKTRRSAFRTSNLQKAMTANFRDLLWKTWQSWWSWIYFSEGVLIFAGNAATIAVFWRRRAALRRASFLLINLSVADLFVGVGLLTIKVTSLLHNEQVAASIVGVASLSLALSATASICSLTVIAVERAFAVSKPLKHRAVPTAYYHRVIGVLWLASVMVTVLLVLVYSGQQYLRFIVCTFCIACLLTMSLSYAVIWRSSLKRPVEHVHANHRVQNRKLAKTLAIVTFLSLSTWLPMQVFLVFPTENLFGTHWVPYFVFLGLDWSNSLLNPFVYVLRMPEFRHELKRIFGKLCQD